MFFYFIFAIRYVYTRYYHYYHQKFPGFFSIFNWSFLLTFPCRKDLQKIQKIHGLKALRVDECFPIR